MGSLRLVVALVFLLSTGGCLTGQLWGPDPDGRVDGPGAGRFEVSRSLRATTHGRLEATRLRLVSSDCEWSQLGVVPDAEAGGTCLELTPANRGEHFAALAMQLADPATTGVLSVFVVDDEPARWLLRVAPADERLPQRGNAAVFADGVERGSVACRARLVDGADETVAGAPARVSAVTRRGAPPWPIPVRVALTPLAVAGDAALLAASLCLYMLFPVYALVGGAG